MVPLSLGQEDEARMSIRVPELADMAPVPQSDGHCRVVAIAYREAMDYFCALYAVIALALFASPLRPITSTLATILAMRQMLAGCDGKQFLIHYNHVP
jgi:hypothetical protein